MSKKKYFVLVGVGLILMVIGELIHQPEYVSGLLTGAGLWLALWGTLGDILKDVTIIKSTNITATNVTIENAEYVDQGPRPKEKS